MLTMIKIPRAICFQHLVSISCTSVTSIITENRYYGKQRAVSYSSASISNSSSTHALFACVLELDFADASHPESEKSAAATVSYGIFSAENPYPSKSISNILICSILKSDNTILLGSSPFTWVTSTLCTPFRMLDSMSFST